MREINLALRTLLESDGELDRVELVASLFEQIDHALL